MSHYEIQYGNYYLIGSNNEILNICDTIDIAFTLSENCIVLHKHGYPEQVNKWAANIRATFTNTGYPDMAAEIVVVEGKIDVEDLEKIINNTGYFEKWYKKHIAEVDTQVGS